MRIGPVNHWAGSCCVSAEAAPADISAIGSSSILISVHHASDEWRWYADQKACSLQEGFAMTFGRRCKEIYWQLHQWFACKNAGLVNAECGCSHGPGWGAAGTLHAPIAARLKSVHGLCPEHRGIRPSVFTTDFVPCFIFQGLRPY